MSHRYLTVRFFELPASVVGPKTRWFVALDYYGKNGCKAALLAKCLTNGKTVTLLDGREKYVTGCTRSGFSVPIGTVAYKIVAAAVAQGVAEFVDESAEFSGS